MVKRKAESDTSSEDESAHVTKKSKNSINQSFVQAANFMSKSQLLHKRLNLSSSLVIPKITKQTSSDNDEDNKTKKKSPKIKKKIRERVSPGIPSESENVESQRYLEEEEHNNDLDNLTTSNKSLVGKEKKSKSTKKRGNNISSPFTPKILPKEEFVQELENDNSKPDSELNRSKEDDNFNNIGEEDARLMHSVEEKIKNVRVLQDVKISPSKDPKQQLNEAYPNLEQQNIKTDIKVKNLHDIFLLRIPKNIDPQHLVNVDINIEKGGKINIGGKYIISPTSKIPPPTLVIGKSSKILQFKKNIVMEKYIKSPKDPKLPVTEKIATPLPTDLKNRHPLFGPNFEEKIQLHEAVEKKLDDAIKNLFKQDKKIKKNKVKKCVEEDKDEFVFSLLNSKTSTKKKAVVDEESIQSLPDKPVKKKKMTKNELIEETLRLMKQELHTEYETDSGTSLRKKKKQKKSQLKPIQNGTLPNASIKQENDPIEIPPQFNRKSLVNSTMLPNSSKLAGFNSDVSWISEEFSEKVTKRKKKKRKSESNISNECGVEHFTEPLIIKKRKIKEEPYESDNVVKKKKKRKDLEVA